MQLLTVSVSPVKEVIYQGKTVTTGILKEPVPGRVMVRRLNIDGDDQADRRVHGGLDMAVYAYPVEHYPFWEGELGRKDFPHGQFGENLTVSGMDEETVRVGDIFRIGGALLQVTQPRIPCYKLAIRMEQGLDFPGRFQQTGRMGFYFRVLEEGEVGAGDPVELLERDESSATIAQFIRVYLHDAHDPPSLKRVLGSRDLGDAWRVYLEKMLKKAEPVTGPAGWEGFRTFVVNRKVPESETVTSFYLAPKDGEPLPSFLPGQFLTFRLLLPEHPRPILRTYSLSDSPNHPEYYRVSVKRLEPPEGRSGLPEGLASSYLHDKVGPGSELCIKSPRGKFYLHPDENSPVVLLSGGVGITPTMSMLNAIVESRSGRTVWFVHGTRNGRAHAMGSHVRGLAAENENLHVHIGYSRPLPEDVEGRDYDTGGRIGIETLQALLPPAAYDFYLCGPPSFMRTLYNGLLEWGVPEGRIYYEFFGPASALKEGAEAAGRREQVAAGGRLTVCFDKSGLAADWDPSEESILALAEAQGLRPDFSCRTGICHTCSSELIQGEVEYVTEPLDRPDPGCVLICVAAPRTDVVVDV